MCNVDYAGGRYPGIAQVDRETGLASCFSSPDGLTFPFTTYRRLLRSNGTWVAGSASAAAPPAGSLQVGVERDGTPTDACRVRFDKPAKGALLAPSGYATGRFWPGQPVDVPDPAWDATLTRRRGCHVPYDVKSLYRGRKVFNAFGVLVSP